MSSQTSIFRPRQRKLVVVFGSCIKTKHKIDGTLIVSPSIALPATRPSIRSPAAGSQKGRWETISGVSKDRWQIISGVCNGRCRKKSTRKGKLSSKYGLRLLWLCRTCDGIRGLPKVLHGMQHVRTQPQDERVSESRLYQVPGHRTYGASVHFLRYVPNKSREEHMRHGMCHDRTVPEHERVSEPSLTKCQATGHNARQCTFCDTCQTNHGRKHVRISNAHIARNTVMMRSDVLKSPRLCAMHAAPTRTKRQGQSIVRSTNAQRAKVCTKAN